MTRIAIKCFLENEAFFLKFTDDLKNGKVAVLPTDTLYGFAADAGNPKGVDAIYRMKGREEMKPLILFLNDVVKLSGIGIVLDDFQRDFLAKHWPGAVTAIFPLAGRPLAAFHHLTLGVRIPAHEGLLKILAKYPGNLLTTSVNVSGQPPLNDPQEIDTKFSDGISWLIDDGTLPISPPSTVVDMSCRPPKVLRLGKVLP